MMKSILVLLGCMVWANASWAWGAAGQVVRGSFSNEVGSRSYQLYVPANKTESMPLFVVLHGCFMTGDQMISGTQMNALAEQRSFYVLYPEQTYGDNPWKCWNWFRPENQSRETGENSLIAGMTRKVTDEYRNIDKSKVFVAGISAGGATATNLIGCYSDVFAGAMVHSGLEYAAAQSEDEAHKVTKNAPSKDLDASARQAVNCSPARDKLIPVITFHGSADPYVTPLNSDRVVTQFAKINQLLRSNSVITERATTLEPVDRKFRAQVADLLFDGQLTIRKVTVEGMGHGWSGGQPTAPYMEPRGVDASRLMVEFFLDRK